MTLQSAGTQFEAVQWWGFRFPFRHYRASNVFDRETYNRMSASFAGILEATEGNCDGPYKLAKTTQNYDAKVLAISTPLASMFNPLFSTEWLRALHGFLGLPDIGRVDGALHSSAKGSRDGWIHSDLCTGWFDESLPPAAPLLFPHRARCEYFTGQRHHPDTKAIEYVRAAVLIYYICNDGWTAGDGGETALYAASHHNPRTTFDRVPPINNTLLLFECSPHSYHRFLANPGRPRNSIIMWLHASLEHARSLWGDSAIHRSQSSKLT